jgi:TPR repeat protein
VQTVERTPPAPQRTPPAQNVERVAPPAPVERPAPPQVAERSPQAPARSLDPAEVDVLVKQGQQFVAAGDFVTARLVFQRAAEAGNAAAALALGASYDPVVLSRLGVRGVDADVGKARAWYQKAKEYGAPDADRRLSTLANR